MRRSPLATIAAVAAAALAAGACGAPRPPAPTTGAIAGLVRDRVTGEPLDATLTVHDQASFAVATGRAGADGRYRIERLAPGVYDMVVVRAGTTLQLTGIPVTAGHVTAFDVPIDLGEVEVPPVAFDEVQGRDLQTFAPPDLAPHLGRLEGTVTDLVTRERVAGAVVTAVSDVLFEVLTEVSDDDGRFRFRDVPPGVYTLSAFYQVPNRGQIEVRRDRVDVRPGEAVIVPIFIEVTGSR